MFRVRVFAGDAPFDDGLIGRRALSDAHGVELHVHGNTAVWSAAMGRDDAIHGSDWALRVGDPDPAVRTEALATGRAHVSAHMARARSTAELALLSTQLPDRVAAWWDAQRSANAARTWLRRTGALGAQALDRVRAGIRVAIDGAPNSGKSRLFNALAGAELSSVADEIGTTRDPVYAAGECEGYAVTWIDLPSAPWADDVSPLALAINEARTHVHASAVVVWLGDDPSRPLTFDPEDIGDRDALGTLRRVLVAQMPDVPQGPSVPPMPLSSLDLLAWGATT
jgi:hypothetical protein